MQNIVRKTGLITAGAIVALAIWPGPASAHVTVNPSEASQGGFAKLTFRVPNEKEGASTTKVEVTLPTDSPLGFVSVKQTAGWKATVTKAKLAAPIKTDDGEVTEAVSRVTWTSDSPATAIKTGEFQEFDLSVGPLPEKDSMVFKALQTYSDGEVVRWIDEATGSAEPEHPAPVLTLTKAAASAETAVQNTATSSEDDGDESSNGLAIGLAIAGLVAGLAGLALGGLAFTRSRRTA
jgi:uncharacterized protein YcnI